MRYALFCLAFGVTTLSGVSKAEDFPFEAIKLDDGVLMIDKATGQNWIMETGTPHPQRMPRSWNQIQLPRFGMRPMGDMSPPYAPQHLLPGSFGPGQFGPPPNPQMGMHPGFSPMMQPPIQSGPSMQPGMPGGPSGSYSQAVPMEQTQRFQPEFPQAPPSAPEPTVEAEASTEQQPVADQSVINAGQPPVLMIVSDSEIDLDEALLLRLTLSPNVSDSEQPKISVEFPADGKLVRGGNPSSISDDGTGTTNRITISYAGDKPLELVFRFGEPGKKPLTVSVEQAGQTNSVNFNVMVEKDDDDEKKDSPVSSQKKKRREKT